MSDAALAEAVLRALESLDAACLDFLSADRAEPRAPELVREMLRQVDACKAELLGHDLLRLDQLAVRVLRSPPGEWGIQFREDVMGRQGEDIDQLHRRVRYRHTPLLHLVGLLRGSVAGPPPAQAPAAAPSAAKTGGKRGTINQRMLEELHRDPETVHLSQQAWAERLGCVASAIAKTQAWKNIMRARAMDVAERMDRQHKAEGQDRRRK